VFHRSIRPIPQTLGQDKKWRPNDEKITAGPDLPNVRNRREKTGGGRCRAHAKEGKDIKRRLIRKLILIKKGGKKGRKNTAGPD